MRARTKYIVVYVTFPDLRTARRIVEGLVRTRRAACGNIFRISSIYRWKGRIEKGAEYAALIKTRASTYRSVERYIRERHPYEVPEIIEWNIVGGLPAYLAWIKKTTDRTNGSQVGRRPAKVAQK